MAFKKTSGTITVEATLTERGREKMAKGEFLISKFALGDDEIDYALFDKDIIYDEGTLMANKTQPILEAYSHQFAEKVSDKAFLIAEEIKEDKPVGLMSKREELI